MTNKQIKFNVMDVSNARKPTENHEISRRQNLRSVRPNADYVLQTTKGFTRKQPSVAFKDQHREKYVSKYMADLSLKGNEKIKEEYRKQAKCLDEEAMALERLISEYQEKVSTYGGIALDLEASVQAKLEERNELLRNIERQKEETICLQKEVSRRQELLERYQRYHSFLDKLHEESGIEVSNLQMLRAVFSSMEDHCISILKENQKTRMTMKTAKKSEEKCRAESEMRLGAFQAPVNNLNTTIQKLTAKTEKCGAEIRNFEGNAIQRDATIKKLVFQVNSTYTKCIIHSSIQVSTEMMLAEIEHYLYNLLDEMKTFPEGKLLSTAKAIRKEELRRQQELKLEALKKK